MTQLFMGYKPGVGQVLKCLRYDGDDPLTLSNDAHERYLFNSENQNLSYGFTSEPFWFRSADMAALGNSFDLYNNHISGRQGVGSAFRSVLLVYRLNKIWPELTYPPIPEMRDKDLNTGRVSAGTRRVQLLYDSGGVEKGYVDSYQFNYRMLRVTGYSTSYSTQVPQLTYTGQLHNDLNRVALGEWVVPISQTVYNDDRSKSVIYPNIWDLPADSSAMRTYSYVPGLLSFIQNASEFKLARPGHSVYDSGLHTKIIDSDRSPALCIMAGDRSNIPAGGSVTLYPPVGVVISDTAVTEFMYRRVGQPWYVPGFIASGYVRETRFNISYSVSPNSVTIYNEGTDPIDVRFAVTNIDRSGTSTGGNLVEYEGHDGTTRFIQFKKPGTTDPASKPNDILFDTRFPTLQIIKEGFIPISSFGAAPAGEQNLFGKVKATVPFTNNGFLPFLKFSIVFPNCVSTPFMSLLYNYPGGWGPPSNVSMLGQIDNNLATFWASPGNWSRREIDGTEVKERYDLPDPIGVRYFIRGIVQP